MGNNTSSSAMTTVGVAISMISVTGTIAVFTLIRLLRRISASVGIAAPTAAMLQQEDAAIKCALFRHFPSLSKKLAWRSLGAEDESPIHVCKNDESKNLMFLVKREDLISPLYGGNKVRTLQHQLAVCEAKREGGEKAFKHLVSLGSGGSNQVIATVVHARNLGWDNAPDGNTITPCWFDKDEPDLDNTLNMLSVFSFPLQTSFDWGTNVGLWTTIKSLRQAWTQTETIPMMLGGNCPVGVLGQAGALLELAEQIEGGKCPDVERIYLPVGSACTVAGLILGTALVRHLKLKALSSPNFKIVGCNVHEGFSMLDRVLGFHKNLMLSFMPLTITHTVIGACRTLKEVGGPDVEKEALQLLQTSLDVRADADVVGKYGSHSEKSRAASKWYEAGGEVKDYKSKDKAKELWVCGHFVSKALQPLLQDLEDEAKKADMAQPKYMLWMTKSAIQPRGEVNEWSAFEKVNDTVKKWADEGKAESIFRPGQVSTWFGKPEDYRSIMTQIFVKEKRVV